MSADEAVDRVGGLLLDDPAGWSYDDLVAFGVNPPFDYGGVGAHDFRGGCVLVHALGSDAFDPASAAPAVARHPRLRGLRPPGRRSAGDARRGRRPRRLGPESRAENPLRRTTTARSSRSSSRVVTVRGARRRLPHRRGVPERSRPVRGFVSSCVSAGHRRRLVRLRRTSPAVTGVPIDRSESGLSAGSGHFRGSFLSIGPPGRASAPGWTPHTGPSLLCGSVESQHAGHTLRAGRGRSPDEHARRRGQAHRRGQEPDPACCPRHRRCRRVGDLEPAQGHRHRHARPRLRQHRVLQESPSPTSTATRASCATAGTRSSSWPRSRSFLEVVLPAHLRRAAEPSQLAEFDDRIRRHTMLHEDLKAFFDGSRATRTRCRCCRRPSRALSTFYQDSLDPFDKEQVELATVRAAGEAADHRRIRATRSPSASRSSTRTTRCAHRELPPHDVRRSRPSPTRSTRPSSRRSTCCSSCTPTTSRTARRRRCAWSAPPRPTCSPRVSAGINALFGPLHGGANQAVLEMLEQIQRRRTTSRPS